VSTTRIDLTVNGTPVSVTIGAHQPLLDVLRDELELTGTKECCAMGECGACTVIVDGRPVNSCLMLAAEAGGRSVTTVEGLGHKDLNRIQEAFLAHGAVQCGFCIPGMIVSATCLLEACPRPTAEQVREGLSGHLCRCGGYSRITAAVLAAAREGPA
jgi:aerobic-type carbon monoxide dehydrogenase small subunit (CoxS/CutS family)